MDNNTLNGFEAVFDALNPHVGDKSNNNVSDEIVESLTDEELEQLTKKKKPTDIKDKKDKVEDNTDDIDDDDVDDIDNNDDNNDDHSNKDDDGSTSAVDNTDNDEEKIIVGFFDSLSEQLGWDDIDEEDKPHNAEDLIEYFKEVIEENSVPQYASEEVAALDNFVRNGGNLRDYFTIDGELDLDNIDITEEVNQKLVVKELLREKGFSAKQIDKKLTKYEDAGILEDEATDALDDLKEIKQKHKEELLEQQKKQAEEAKKQQQNFFNNVLTEIKGMDSIYGIEIPEKDKRLLLEYIFKPDANGITKYQRDYAKSLKNLITSAYFTMKGDSLIDIAKKKGKRDALDNFKNSLTKNSGVNKKSRKQVINTDDNMSIWDTFTRKIRTI